MKRTIVKILAHNHTKYLLAFDKTKELFVSVKTNRFVLYFLKRAIRKLLKELERTYCATCLKRAMNVEFFKETPEIVKRCFKKTT